MIERYTLTSLDEIAARFGAPPPDARPRFNIAPLQIAPVATAAGVIAARWGLLPPWRGHGGKRAPHILHAPLATPSPLAAAHAAPAAWPTGTPGRAAPRGTAARTGPAGWRAEPVGPWVNSVHHDDPRCVEPRGSPAQGELF